MDVPGTEAVLVERPFFVIAARPEGTLPFSSLAVHETVATGTEEAFVLPVPAEGGPGLRGLVSVTGGTGEGTRPEGFVGILPEGGPAETVAVGTADIAAGGLVPLVIEAGEGRRAVFPEGAAALVPGGQAVSAAALVAPALGGVFPAGLAAVAFARILSIGMAAAFGHAAEIGHQDAVLAQAVGIAAGHIDLFPVLVAAAVIHGRGDAARRGDETLGLLRAPVALLQPAGQLVHVLVRTAGEGAHHVGHHILLASGPTALLHEALEEGLEDFHARLAHQVQHAGGAVLRGHLELAAGEFAGIGRQGLRIVEGQVGAHAAGHAHLPHAGQGRHLAQQAHMLHLRSDEGLADRGVTAAAAAAAGRRPRAGLRPGGRGVVQGAVGLPHVGSGAAHVGDGHLAATGLGHQRAGLGQDGLLAAGADAAPLVQGQRAEGTAAAAAAMAGDAGAQHLVGRDGLAVAGMGRAGVGQRVDLVHLFRGQGPGRGRQHQGAVAHHLLGPGVLAVHLLLQHLGQAQQLRGLGLHGLVGGQLHARQVEPFFGQVHGDVVLVHFGQPGRAVDAVQALAFGQTAGAFQHGQLAHAVDEQVGLGVQQDGAAQAVGPEIVMGGAAQRGLDAAQDHRQAGEGLTGQVGIDQTGAVGTRAGLAAGGVGIIVALFAEGRVVGQHGVQRARADAREKPGTAHDQQVIGRLPAGLGHDAHAETVGHQPAAQQHGPEGRVVHIGVAVDQQHVQFLPAQGLHLGAAHGQEAGLTVHPRVLERLVAGPGAGAGIAAIRGTPGTREVPGRAASVTGAVFTAGTAVPERRFVAFLALETGTVGRLRAGGRTRAERTGRGVGGADVGIGGRGSAPGLGEEGHGFPLAAWGRHMEGMKGQKGGTAVPWKGERPAGTRGRSP